MESTAFRKPSRFQGRSGAETRSVMLDVILSLVPAAIASVILFGPRALMIIAVCVASCVLSEYVFRRVMKLENTIGDLSAAVTGILLAFSLPVTVHPLIAAFGGIVAVVAVKQLFGGLGRNPVNPALTARILLTAVFPAELTKWVSPFYYLHSSAADAAAVVTPLGLLKQGAPAAQFPGYLNMLVGDRAGCLGATCALALILGGVYLVARKEISPVIPLCFLGTAVLLSLCMGRNLLLDLLSGGLLLGSIFMATDYATSPLTLRGQILYAVGCGAVTLLIRRFGSLTEGVALAIVLMNLLAPLLDRAANPAAWKELVKKHGTGR